MIKHIKKYKKGLFGRKKRLVSLKSRHEVYPKDIKSIGLKLSQSVSSGEFCCLHFKKTKNNAYCVISQLFGRQKTLWRISGGMVHAQSKTNGRRKTRFTQRMIFKAALEKLLSMGFKYLVIHCSGTTISKRYIFRNFYKRFKIVLLKDKTGNAHNGCRAPNVRRV